ncbi:MAG: NUDIX hydrolase [Erysipelotrichaceae bacterium]|nr:NUDIX hydrolase [Erysipelotrichaceae bacterium]
MSEKWEENKGLLTWKLEDVKQETNHPFLNFYTLTYEVSKEQQHKIYPYYMVSRKDAKDLRPQSQEYRRPDAVIIGLYRKEKDGISVLLNKQFRPAFGHYVYSVAAGLVDGNESIEECARREAHEECGAQIDDIEILTPFSPSATGMSDEANAMVMARVVSMGQKDLEEFEDISSKFVTLDEAKRMMRDPHYIFALNGLLWLHYLLARFGKE